MSPESPTSTPEETPGPRVMGASSSSQYLEASPQPPASLGPQKRGVSEKISLRMSGLTQHVCVQPILSDCYLSVTQISLGRPEQLTMIIQLPGRGQPGAGGTAGWHPRGCSSGSPHSTKPWGVCPQLTCQAKTPSQPPPRVTTHKFKYNTPT